MLRIIQLELVIPEWVHVCSTQVTVCMRLCVCFVCVCVFESVCVCACVARHVCILDTRVRRLCIVYYDTIYIFMLYVRP